MKTIKLLILVLFLTTSAGADVYNHLTYSMGDVGGFYSPNVDFVGDDFYPWDYTYGDFPITIEKIVIQVCRPGTYPPAVDRIVYNIIRKSDMVLMYFGTEYEPEGALDWRDSPSDTYVYRYEHELSCYLEAGKYIIATEVFGSGDRVLVNNVHWLPAIHGEHPYGWYTIDGVNDAAMKIEFQWEESVINSTSLGNIKATYK